MNNLPPAGTEALPLGEPIGTHSPPNLPPRHTATTSPVVIPVSEDGPPLPPKSEYTPISTPAPAPGQPPARAEPVIIAPPEQVIDTTHPSTDSHPSNLTTAPTAPTASIDPNIPSSESAPTALPTNPNTHPTDQKRALENEKPEVVSREVEKTKAAERELKGEEALGTVVRGIEDDRLYAMLRRFDTVSHQ